MPPIPLLLIAAAAAVSAPAVSPIHLEAENAELNGPHVATARAGYSGTGYVTGFEHDGDRIVFRVKAQAGIYAVRIRYASPYGPKGFDLDVNGSRSSGTFAKTGEGFARASAGTVELKAGANTIALEKGWGYYDVDALDLLPAAAPAPPRRPPLRLADAQATPKTRALMAFLIRQYGRQTLSGQYGEQDSATIRSVTGRTPAIFGSDLMDYSPSRVARGGMPKDVTEKAIAAVRAGRILTLSWHWNAPKDLLDKRYRNARGEEIDASWYKGFYTNATTFDVAYAMDHPESADYRLLLRDIDAIAVQLKKLADADIPVLWRPLHEAEGGWFWWGAKGPKPYIRLYRLLFDRLVHRHHLHNLIWVHNCSSPDWYPGDDVVDIESIDAYPQDPSDPQIASWEALQKRFDGKKLLAIAEYGGVPDVEKMHRFGADWAYFVTWNGFLTRYQSDPALLSRLYNSPAVCNQPSLPNRPARR